MKRVSAPGAPSINCLEVRVQTRTITASNISKKTMFLGGMAPSEWMRSVRADRDTPAGAYFMPSANTTRRVVYHPPIDVSPFLGVLSVSHFK